MEKILCLFSICLFFTGLQAQNIDKNKIAPVSKRQIEVDTREIEQFEEQHESFFQAMESKDDKEVTAAKQMIKETMLREIEQSKMVVEPTPKIEEKVISKTEIKPRTTTNSSEARTTELSSRRSQEAQQRVQRNNSRRAAESSIRKATPSNRVDTELSKAQQAIYQEFVSMKFDPNNMFNHARLNKLLSSFSEILEQDLEEKKKRLSDQQ